MNTEFQKIYDKNKNGYRKIVIASVIAVWCAAIIKLAVISVSLFANGGSAGIMSEIKTIFNIHTDKAVMKIYIRNLTLSILFLSVLFFLATSLLVTSLKAIKTKNFLTLKPWVSYSIMIFISGSLITPMFFDKSFNINLNNTIWYTNMLSAFSWISYCVLLVFVWFNTRIIKIAYTAKNFDKLMNIRGNKFGFNKNNMNQGNSTPINKSETEREAQINAWKNINDNKTIAQRGIIEHSTDIIKNKTDFSNFNIEDLKSLAKKIGINDYGEMSRDQLIVILRDIQN